MAEKALNILELKNNNRYRILDLLRYEPLSRAEVSLKTGLAKSSVTTLVNEMINEGILLELGPARKNGTAGRTRILLDINGSYGFVLGINLHRKRISVAAVDIKGKELWSFTLPTGDITTIEALELIKKTLPKKLAETKLNIKNLLGLGVSAPGPLDCEKGVILEPPNFKLFNNFPIVEALKKEFGCPVVLENDAVTLALAEHSYVKKQIGSSLFVTVSNGIGGALLKNGDIYGGSHGIAGELGHISIDPFGEECPCGNRGCLEQYATLSALKNRFDIADSVELTSENSQKGKAAFDFLINTMGTALVGAVNLFDLDTVILYGEFDNDTEKITAALEEYIKSHSVICRVHPVKVVPSGLKRGSSAFAAAIPAINYFFNNSV
ncbi:MAG: ROK family transcriptional regulator [Clostridia bacterium]|nr:ROK family transcriptional regulator [Clostridia bacterium]